MVPGPLAQNSQSNYSINYYQCQPGLLRSWKSISIIFAFVLHQLQDRDQPGIAGNLTCAYLFHGHSLKSEAQLKHPVPNTEFLERVFETLCFPSTATGISLHQPAIIPLFESVLCFTHSMERQTHLLANTPILQPHSPLVCTSFSSFYISSNIYGDGLDQGSKFTSLVLHPPSDALHLDFIPSPLQI